MQNWTDSLKRQVSELTTRIYRLTKANQRYRLERDQDRKINKSLNCEVQDLEREICRQRSSIECLHERVRKELLLGFLCE